MYKTKIDGKIISVSPPVDTIEFGLIQDKEIIEFLLKAVKENIALEILGCQIGVQPGDATLSDYQLMYSVAKKLMEENGLKEVD